MKKKQKQKPIKNMKDSKGDYFIKDDILVSRVLKTLMIKCLKINKKGGLFICNSNWLTDPFFISNRFMRTCLWVIN